MQSHPYKTTLSSVKEVMKLFPIETAASRVSCHVIPSVTYPQLIHTKCYQLYMTLLGCSKTICLTSLEMAMNCVNHHVTNLVSRLLISHFLTNINLR